MGKPAWSYVHARQTEFIGLDEGTGGTETSYYLEEEKVNNDSVSSGERMRKSPNLLGFRLVTDG